MENTISNFETIKYDVRESIATVTFDRAKKLNSISARMSEEILDGLDEAERDPNVKVVLLTGAGDNFSSGADIKEAVEMYPSMGEEPSETYREHYEHYLNVSLKIWDCKKPVIAVVDGYALGAAADWVFSADVAIASDRATIGEPEILLGEAPPTLMMPWIIGIRKSKELLLTGDLVDAQEAYRLGMFNKVVPPEDLMEEAFTMAKKMARVSPSALKITKQTINKIYEMMNIKESLDYNVESAISMFFLNRESDHAKTLEEINRIGLSTYLKKAQE